MARGRLIVIEGLDRSGKSTQCAHLLSALQQEGTSSSSTTAELYKFPDRTTAIGTMIDGYLRSTTTLDDRAIHLLFSANRWERADTILASLAAGRHVLCDRYLYSGIAYSLTKPGLEPGWCRAGDVGLPLPDAIFFLDVPEDVARRRGGFGQERYERVETQRAVRAQFLQLFHADETVTFVDAAHDVQHVRRKIWEKVQDLLATEPGPLGQFS
ncbi:protein of unknown function [Taphrina deformans PYCC 5710]|uniref:Thymidylate kinase n=1 Tax=Taphrina deformans (strain PYCC 5710 / ATCC 11124 / CBS 356.35 / IMI 108563 / JCM 9778 / NBRC 8474) TaxID=1097556 RepID=R4XEV6_TAPDE|nr:protein of unknown function [Taphrina deformans PYCC 5710]|eukprot:CCG84153.1 protein of unknown function [Taphrina deformans PYCC 5710]